MLRLRQTSFFPISLFSPSVILFFLAMCILLGNHVCFFFLKASNFQLFNFSILAFFDRVSFFLLFISFGMGRKMGEGFFFGAHYTTTRWGCWCCCLFLDTWFGILYLHLKRRSTLTIGDKVFFSGRGGGGKRVKSGSSHAHSRTHAHRERERERDKHARSWIFFFGANCNMK